MCVVFRTTRAVNSARVVREEVAAAAALWSIRTLAARSSLGQSEKLETGRRAEIGLRSSVETRGKSCSLATCSRGSGLHRSASDSSWHCIGQEEISESVIDYRKSGTRKRNRRTLEARGASRPDGPQLKGGDLISHRGLVSSEAAGKPSIEALVSSSRREGVQTTTVQMQTGLLGTAEGRAGRGKTVQV